MIARDGEETEERERRRLKNRRKKGYTIGMNREG